MDMEKAARELCRIRGIDPDRSVAHGAAPDENGFVPDICLYSPAWQLLAGEVERQLQVSEAIAFANQSGGEG